MSEQKLRPLVSSLGRGGKEHKQKCVSDGMGRGSPNGFSLGCQRSAVPSLRGPMRQNAARMKKPLHPGRDDQSPFVGRENAKGHPEALWIAYVSSFRPQRYGGIDASGAEGWEVSGQKSHEDQKKRDACKGNGIVGVCVKQKRGDYLRCGERKDRSKGDAKESEF